MRLTAKIGAAACLVAFWLSSFSARADVTYNYTGSDFTVAIGVFTTSDAVSGSLTLASPLADNLSLATVTPVSFSFTNGFDTFTDADVIGAKNVEFSTDSTGDITGWYVDAYVGSGDSFSASNTGDTAGSSGFGSVGLSFTGGVWTETTSATTPVPEPASWPLVVMGVGMVAALRVGARRKKETRGKLRPA